jgi:predicted NBD/HSP70 family sugar kinase
MAYYTVSTGANAVRIVDGQVDRTIGWYELGKQIINHDQKYPIELEPLVGGAALEHRTGLKPHDVKDPEIWRQIEHFLAIGLFNTALYWNPKLIVLGGSMMVDIKLDKLQVEMNNLPDVLAQRPTLVLAKLTDEAGLIGAAEMASQLGYK